MHRASLVITVSAALIATAAGAAAQCPRNPDTPAAAGPKTLVGIVSDTGQVAVDSADVIIVSQRKETLTRTNGTFRLNGLKAGSYEVTARRFGFLPQVRTVVVGDSGGVGSFCLVPYTHGLAPVVSAAKRGGLTGVVGDTDYKALPDVDVSVMGSEKRAVVDSTGNFFLDLRPGQYMVRFKHSGFATRMVSVTIPSDSGRKVIVWMTPTTATSMFEEENAREFAIRIDTASSTRSRLYTREDLNKLGATDVIQVAKMGLTSKVNDDCDVIVDGGPLTMPIWQLKTADVEMLEVYVDKQTNAKVTSISRGSSAIRAQGPPPSIAPNGCGSVHVYAWLRK